jgi:hypothetical protein
MDTAALSSNAEIGPLKKIQKVFLLTRMIAEVIMMKKKIDQF